MSENRMVAFVMPGTKQTASNRFRFLQYIYFFRESGITCSLFYVKSQYCRGEDACSQRSLWGIVQIFVNVIRMVRLTWQYDRIIIQRYLIHPLLPVTIFFPPQYTKKLIVDLDDAVFYKHPVLYSFFVRNVARVIVGNSYLAAYINKYHDDCVIIPTAVDTTRYYPVQKPHNSPIVRIGWIGSPKGVSYLQTILQILEHISCDQQFKLCIMSDFNRTKPLTSSKCHIECVQWSESAEVQFLHSLDIGLMPLPDNSFTRGKCAYKVLQYMASGVPPIASNIGMNSEVIEDGVDGFLYSNNQEFERKLITLFKNTTLRCLMAERACKKTKQKYSLDVLKSLFFNAVID